MEKNKNILEFIEYNANVFLINSHTIGSLRDESDLEIAKYHTSMTINFTLDFLKNIDGSIESKIEFLEKMVTNIKNFKIKNDNEILMDYRRKKLDIIFNKNE